MAVLPQAFVLRRYSDGEILSTQPLVPLAQDVYGAPYWYVHIPAPPAAKFPANQPEPPHLNRHVHRADFHRTMVQKALDLGVDIQLSCCVVKIDFDVPRVYLKDGRHVAADLVIGADGLKSVCRDEMLAKSDPPHLTGDLAYRILIKTTDMSKHEDLAELVTNPAINLWMGPSAHAVCYLLQGGGLYNIVLLCPDTLPDSVNIATAGAQEVRDFFKNWDPRLLKLLNMVHEVSKWRLQNSTEMDTWLHPAGKFVLLGDACHATLPYLAQGAAMAVEDGAVLGGLLGKLEDKSQLGAVLAIYESLRKKRTTRIVLESTNQRDVFHLPNGEKQEDRDAIMVADEQKPGFPNKWRDPELQKFMFGYNAFEEVETAWEKFKNEGEVVGGL